MKLTTSIMVVALLMQDANAITKQTKKVSTESREIINNAVNDVLSITGAPDTIVHHSHDVHHVHHHHHYPVPVPVAAAAPVEVAPGVVAPVVAPVVAGVPVIAPKPVIVKVPGPTNTIEKVVYVPKEVPVVVPAPPPAKPPHSSVMRAVADANEASAADKVAEQRDVASKLEKIES
jgi:hypothetical protein